MNPPMTAAEKELSDLRITLAIAIRQRREKLQLSQKVLIRLDFHDSKQVPTETCHDILKAAGIPKP